MCGLMVLEKTFEPSLEHSPSSLMIPRNFQFGILMDLQPVSLRIVAEMNSVNSS